MASGKILASAIKQKLEKVNELTGLDFSRFTKSMMLSQGQFAAFLNADANDRAELLEELTGTEIYGLISEAVYSRFKLEDEKLKQLKAKADGVNLLSEEEREELTQTRLQVEANKKQLDQELEQLEQQMRWWLELEKAQAGVNEATQEHQNLAQTLESHADDLTRLEKSIPAQAIQPQYAELNNLRAELHAEKEVFHKGSDALGELNKTLTEKEGLKSTSEKSHSEQKQKLETLDALAVKVRPLDSEIVSLNKELNSKTEQVSDASKELSEKSNAFKVKQHELDTLKHEQAVITDYLDSNARFEHLATEIVQIRGDAKTLADKQKQLADKATALNSLVDQKQTKLSQNSDLKKRLRAQLEEQSNLELASVKAADELEQFQKSNSLETLETRKQFIESCYFEQAELKRLNSEYLTSVKGVSDSEAEKSRLEKELQTKKVDIERLIERYKDKKKLVTSLETQIGQEGELTKYRALLKQGDACPLCGSIEHHIEQNADIVALTQQKEQEQQLCSEIEAEGKKVRESIADIERTLSSLAKSVQEMERQKSNAMSGWATLLEKLKAQSLAIGKGELLTRLSLENSDSIAAFIDLVSTELNKINELYRASMTLEKTKQEADSAKFSSDAVTKGVQKELEFSEQTLQSLIENETSWTKESEELSNQAVQSQKALNERISGLGYELPELSQIPVWLEALELEAKTWRENKDLQQQNATMIASFESETRTLKVRSAELEKSIGDHKDSLTKLQDSLQVVSNNRLALYQGENIDLELSGLKKLVIEHQDKLESAKQLYSDAKSAVEKQVATLEAKQVQIDKLVERESQAINLWKTALSESTFEDEQAFISALLPKEQHDHLLALKTELDKQALATKTRLDSATESLNKLKRSEMAEKVTPKQELEQGLSESKSEQANLQTKLGGIAERIKLDDENRENQKQLFEDILKAQASYDDMAYLNSLIGSQKGDKFRKFAQGLTLENLVYLANKHLQRLHGRYELKRNLDDGLALQVMDLWQGDVVRDTKTLSGGESFLVSLALALSLSDLVSHKTSIDSLFLDEGFGTLDPETLDLALDALDTLNATGKMIGVISHVNALKERVPVQIKVSKKVGLGESQLAREYAVS
ncbi:exonuclease sbcC [Vibrio ishigakensis]|uniref:Exonuclease sbcC n=1 Tax=Vibrio ishigakensis TaxID=1481914 RepID=A0A0B8QMT3_9VIBR|nr:exonuclease sbcC [Vibrio ishigakensis]